MDSEQVSEIREDVAETREMLLLYQKQLDTRFRLLDELLCRAMGDDTGYRLHEALAIVQSTLAGTCDPVFVAERLEELLTEPPKGEVCSECMGDRVGPTGVSLSPGVEEEAEGDCDHCNNTSIEPGTEENKD